ncbi:MAG: hypothetical protein PHU85_15650, partial [Phycisphaerae bacterium]|nr:hypothetical protein [Phycisphaerae bacterium]
DSPLGVRVQRLQGVLPLLLWPTPEPKRALVVGLGTGTTIAPLSQFGVERMTVAELAEPVADAAKQFDRANDSLHAKAVREFTKVHEVSAPSKKPAGSGVPPGAAATSRPTAATSKPTTATGSDTPASFRSRLGESQVRIVHADGRTVLRLEPRGWDIILVDIIYPTSAGAGGVFSEQFYRMAGQRLGNNGVFVHWLPLWQMGPDETAAVISAFDSGFKHSKVAFHQFGYLAVPTPGRPMLALVAASSVDPETYWPRWLASLQWQLYALRPVLDRMASRYRPTMKEIGLGSGEQVAAGIVTQTMLAAWANGIASATDTFPRTEFRARLNARDYGRQNLDRLLALGFGQPESAEEIAKLVPALDRAKLGPVLAGRRAAAQGLLELAVKADPDNAFAALEFDASAYDSSLKYIRGQLETKELSPEQAVDVLAGLDRKYPLELKALQLKATIQHDTLKQMTAALGTLDDMIARAPAAADVHYAKAAWLVEQAEADAKAGRVGDARLAAQEAQIALREARMLRPEWPVAYRELLDRIRRQLTASATTQAAGKK